MKNERKNAEYGTGEDAERLHDFLREQAGRSRPHVAPCSCELHVRIRELEARLSDAENRVTAAHARAAELIALEAAFERKAAEQVARAEKAEARVAELESKLIEGANLVGLVGTAGIQKQWMKKVGLAWENYYEPAPAIEGQEREAD